jgi:hypothetical protein
VSARARAALGVALALAASYCSEGPTGPVTGRLLVTLAGAGAADRALLVEVTGADTSAVIDSVAPVPGSPYQVFVQQIARTRWRAVITGPIADGPLLTVRVPDLSKAGLYAGAVLDVADNTFAELAPGARRLSVGP